MNRSPPRACRYWDKKCKDLKEKKTSGLFNQNGNRLHGVIAAASGKSFGNAFDWRASAFSFDKTWSRLQPARLPEQTASPFHQNSRSIKPGDSQKTF